MNTIVIVFAAALLLALCITPAFRVLGIKLGALDLPNKRKVHTRPIPRTGGIAILISFFGALGIASFPDLHIAGHALHESRMLFLAAGALMCFSVGCIDDFRRLNPYVKFLVQVLSASIAYVGGVKIGTIELYGDHILFGPFSYPLTVFWFVLFINAINLVDGLDGLAGGIVLFASVVTLILAVMREDIFTAVLFACLAGSVLGFLRYNFNPASIFLGDGGSYLLGYLIAGLSIVGSVKSQFGVAILIPVLALGVPIFDTILSPLRRFVHGKELFRPDNGHVHHRLLARGLTTKKAVVVIYGITVALCLVAIVLVNVRNERAGVFLFLLGACAVLFMRKLGYLEYLGYEKIFGWLRDLSEETGLSPGRRTFLNLQMEINKSRDLEEMWKNLCAAVDWLGFDFAEFQVGDGHGSSATPDFVSRSWHRDGFKLQTGLCRSSLFKMEMPILNNDRAWIGTLWLVKDLVHDPISHTTLRRVEHLRRTVMQRLRTFS